MGGIKGELIVDNEEKGVGERSVRKLMGINLSYIILATLLSLLAIVILHSYLVKRGRHILGEHLRAAMIEEIEFEEVPLSDALQMIHTKLRLKDPYFETCEFRLDDDMASSQPTITLKLSNAPGIVAIKYTALLSSGGYILQPNRLIIAPYHSDYRDPVEKATDSAQYWVIEKWSIVKYAINPKPSPPYVDPFK